MLMKKLRSHQVKCMSFVCFIQLIRDCTPAQKFGTNFAQQKYGMGKICKVL